MVRDALGGQLDDMPDTALLWRPVGAHELSHIRERQMVSFPPCLPGQQIFYAAATEELAMAIARDWRDRLSIGAFVTRVRVAKPVVDRYDVKAAGNGTHKEYWIPAEELVALNAAILGKIELVAEFPPD